MLAFAVLFSATASNVFSQNQVEQRIINTIPSKVPLKVKIINGEMSTPLDEMEIRVTNSGDKPIYFIQLSMASAEEFAPRNRVGLTSFQIGNSELGDFAISQSLIEEKKKRSEPFEPGATRIFRVDKKLVGPFWDLMNEKGYSNSARIVLQLNILTFADGTGYMTPQAAEMTQKGAGKAEKKYPRFFCTLSDSDGSSLCSV